MYYLAEARFKRLDTAGKEMDGYAYKIAWSTSPDSVINQLRGDISANEEPLGEVTYTSNGPFNSLLEAEAESDKHVKGVE